MENQYKKGSEWRKWDLHFHTPSSYDYKDRSVTNEDIINTLSDNNISVVAITDHHVIDNDRITKLQGLGEEKGITVLPGIEFLSDARGEEPIHFIGIFPAKCKLDFIKGQIENRTEISKIVSESKKANEVYCNLNSTIDLVHELGGVVTIHSGQKHGSVETITNSLKHTMAQKVDIANKVDIYELGKEEDQIGYNEIVFPFIKKTIPMIICSDNHNISQYQLKQNCWIKADPTFEGLKQILIEPEERVFIGEEPEIFKRVKDNRTKYIKELSVNSINGYNNSKGKWFQDVKLELNKELTAIIGNKGSGKSALSDITALCGNCYNPNTFSFIHKNKFRKGGIASNFEGQVVWESDNESKYVLDNNPEDGSVKTVKYLPQGDFETLTNEIEKAEAFQKEIEDVVFSHIEKEDRLGFNTFSELIENQKQNAEASIDFISAEIKELNEKIIQLEKKLNPIFKAEIEGNIKQKEDELKALTEPEKVDNPNENPENAINNEELNQIISDIRKTISEKEAQLDNSRKELSDLSVERNELNGFSQSLKLKEEELISYRNEKKENFLKYGLDIEKVIDVKFDYSELEKLIEKKDGEILILNISINGNNTKKGLIKEIEEEKEKLSEENKKLDGPQKKYQKYLNDKKDWAEKKKQITGDKKTANTLDYYKGVIEYLNENLQSEIEEKRKLRLNLVEKVFEKKKSIITIYEKAKSGIDDRIKENKDLLTSYKINIDASLVLQNNFKDKFLKYISKNKSGSFYSKDGGDYRLQQIIEGKDVNDFEDIKSILESITQALFIDLREDVTGDKKRYIENQVDDIDDFYNYLFSLDYIDYNYQLKLGDKEIEQLSPGERGALLLIFYLLLDKNDIPLILDQPEDNLDNHSVANILVPFIKKAKTKRQIILVTHNPNLAVVADAEQIIWVNIDKEDKNRFIYEVGSIESRVINKHIVNVLEGAMPAFNKRKQKYYED